MSYTDLTDAPTPVTNGHSTPAADTTVAGVLHNVQAEDVRLIEALALLLNKPVREVFADAVKAHRELHVPAFRRQSTSTGATPAASPGRKKKDAAAADESKG